MTAHTSTIIVPHALRYLLQGAVWGERLLLLTLLQLLPIVGQIILIGYGMEVARAVAAGQRDLPPVRVLAAASDGLRLLLAGLVYAAPVALIIPTLLSIGFTRPGEASLSGDFIFILVSLVLAMGIAPVLQRLPAKHKALKSVIMAAIGAVPLLMVVTMIGTLASNPAMLDVRDAQLNGIGVVLLIILALLAFLVVIALHISGLRLALHGKGLLDPTGSLRMLAANRAETGKLLLNFLVVLVLGGAVTILGLPFVLPAAFTLVVTTVALWYILVVSLKSLFDA